LCLSKSKKFYYESTKLSHLVYSNKSNLLLTNITSTFSPHLNDTVILNPIVGGMFLKSSSKMICNYCIRVEEIHLITDTFSNLILKVYKNDKEVKLVIPKHINSNHDDEGVVNLIQNTVNIKFGDEFYVDKELRREFLNIILSLSSPNIIDFYSSSCADSDYLYLPPNTIFKFKSEGYYYTQSSLLTSYTKDYKCNISNEDIEESKLIYRSLTSKSKIILIKYLILLYKQILNPSHLIQIKTYDIINTKKIGEGIGFLKEVENEEDILKLKQNLNILPSVPFIILLKNKINVRLLSKLMRRNIMYCVDEGEEEKEKINTFPKDLIFLNNLNKVLNFILYHVSKYDKNLIKLSLKEALKILSKG